MTAASSNSASQSATAGRCSEKHGKTMEHRVFGTTFRFNPELDSRQACSANARPMEESHNSP